MKLLLITPSKKDLVLFKKWAQQKNSTLKILTIQKHQLHLIEHAIFNDNIDICLICHPSWKEFRHSDLGIPTLYFSYSNGYLPRIFNPYDGLEEVISDESDMLIKSKTQDDWATLGLKQA